MEWTRRRRHQPGHALTMTRCARRCARPSKPGPKHASASSRSTKGPSPRCGAGPNSPLLCSVVARMWCDCSFQTPLLQGVPGSDSTELLTGRARELVGALDVILGPVVASVEAGEAACLRSAQTRVYNRPECHSATHPSRASRRAERDQRLSRVVPRVPRGCRPARHGPGGKRGSPCGGRRSPGHGRHLGAGGGGRLEQGRPHPRQPRRAPPGLVRLR